VMMMMIMITLTVATENQRQQHQHQKYLVFDLRLKMSMDVVIKYAFMHFSLLVLWIFCEFLYLISTHVLSYMKWGRIFQFCILITCKYFHKCCCLTNSLPHDVNEPLWPSLAVLQNNNRSVFFPSSVKKNISLSRLLQLPQLPHS
jgi:hypothetical protein